MFVSEDIYTYGTYVKASDRYKVSSTMPLYKKSNKKPKDFCIRYVPSINAAKQIVITPITGGILVGSMGSSFDSESKKKYIGTIVCTVISLILYLVFLYVLLFKDPSTRRPREVQMTRLSKK